MWLAYRAKRGPLNPMLRTDAAFGRLSVLLSQVHQLKHQSGRPLGMADFVPYASDEEEEASMEELAALLTGPQHG
ncbi:hypothetical protein LVB77_14540 [Lysobacter sp. 5GHs7-4]|uniref:phage tail assembly protein T n=1 Tax=Lysobacter sp. 5GHs7-4 TaxID=2904253 RepID=UPI001E4418E3|nr:hypothetical protein [Lysobacter sp. 5GHs7-4]UHQ21884.1 hypothetical protein LVB77_14540 [Lysobacter sp. 5GHs7-4]